MRVLFFRLARTAAGVLLALVLMILVRSFVDSEAIKVDPELWGIFFTVFGIVYAILVGFLLLECLNRFNTISTTIQDELNAVQDIRDFAIFVNGNEGAKQRIRDTLSAYVKSVVDRGWPGMGQIQRERRGLLSLFSNSKKESPTLESDTTPELYEVMRAVENIKIIDQSDSIALSAIIGKIGEVTSFRTKRVELAKQSLPPTLHFLIIFMSFILGLSFVLMDVSSVWIHALMIVSVNTAVHLLYMVISDLDHPFEGVWNISSDPFTKVSKEIEQRVI